MIRSQFHFRKSGDDLLAWDVRHLIELSKNFPVIKIKLADIAELDEPHWYNHEGDSPTCHSIITHTELINHCDLSFPIILDQNGRVMDGMHRICKAAMRGHNEISAVQFEKDPKPDYINRNPDTLPYD